MVSAINSLTLSLFTNIRDARTFASAIISFLGAGVLGFPFAFKQSGVLVRFASRMLLVCHQIHSHASVCGAYSSDLLCCYSLVR